jgi:hypothetical protein
MLGSTVPECPILESALLLPEGAAAARAPRLIQKELGPGIKI